MMINQQLPRLRTLDEAYAEICKIDPATNISKNSIRQIALSNKVACIMVGRKRLINLDSLLSYLNSDFDSNQTHNRFNSEDQNKIRRIEL